MSEKGGVKESIDRMEAENDWVIVPRGLLAAAAYAISKKKEAPVVLEAIRVYAKGDKV